jgi:TM2 domain-containing membrane protein YozV
MFCPACGTKNDDAARFCQSCGGAITAAAAAPPKPPETVRGAAQAPPATTAAPGEKNPVLALILSLIIVGLGQFYNNDWKKGLLMLGGTILLSVPTGGLAWLGFGIWSVIDAHMVAKGTGKRW